MHRALLFALSGAMIGFTACNKASREKASEKSAEVRQDADKAMKDIKEDAQKATAKVQDEAKQAANDIKDNAADARKNIANEAGKAGDAVRNATDKDGKAVPDERRADNDNGTMRDEARQAGKDVKTEARQTSRDVKEAMGMDQGKTAADKKLNERIRTAIKANKIAARDADDVTLVTEDGHVRLKGTVATEEAKKEIASAARKVAGLTKVNDDVKVAERVGQGSND
jgi:osmotically-inducible protein OsmY